MSNTLLLGEGIILTSDDTPNTLLIKVDFPTPASPQTSARMGQRLSGMCPRAGSLAAQKP
jgi:hypothetical protein